MIRRLITDVRLGLRLMRAAGRESTARMALITFGVGLGVCLLLLVFTALPALQAREARTAWQNTTGAPGAAGPHALWWLPVPDHYRGRDLIRVYVAAEDPGSPVPPGLRSVPAAGELAVSPALGRLRTSAPAEELAARLPGRVTATIGPAGLPSPDDLIAFVGATPEQVRAWGGTEVRAISDRPARVTINGYVRTMLIIAALGLLVPVFVFITMVTRIGAARRERRFAAIRLVGATNSEIAMFAGVETGAAAIAGALVGWAAYGAARPVVARLVTFDGLHFFPGDVAVPTPQLVAVLVAVPLVAAVAAFAALHRVRVTPLGTVRGARRRRPGWWRLAVPGFGIAGFVVVLALRASGAAAANSLALQQLAAASLLLVLIGLVVVGPWICLVIARMLARWSRRVPALMAARRLAVDPQATFRAIAGAVMAAFVTALFAGVTPDPATKPLEHDQLRTGVVEVLAVGQPAELVTALEQRLAQTPGVGRVLVVRAGTAPSTIAVSCADLAAAVNVDCRPGQPLLGPIGLPPRGLMGVGGLAPARDTGPVHALYVFVSGGTAGEDRVRTVTAGVMPAAHTESRTDHVQLDNRQIRELNAGLRAATAFVLLVAACSLTIAAVGSLIERRRPFALLRAAGMHVAELRRVVLLETALPLFGSVALSASLGLAVALPVSRSSGQPWHPPGPDYLLAMLGGVVVALAVTCLTLPLIDAVTRPQTVRFE